MNVKNKIPLISIVVITYNSAKYVLETLESIKAQTYKNIELIVADDCSTDNTVELCEKWFVNNKDYFVKSKIVYSDINRGISVNCNRGVNFSNGSWIKLIAGDDILIPDCIEKFVNLSMESDNKLFFGNMNNFEGETIINKSTDPSILNFFNMNVQKKFKNYCRHAYFLNSPTVFVNRQTLNLLGNFNEKYRYLEDLPLILKFLENNEDIGFLHDYVVLRRIHQESISTQTTSVNEYRKQFLINLFNIYSDLRRPNFKWYNIKDNYYKIMNDMNFSMYRKPPFWVKIVHDIIVNCSKLKRKIMK
jgi:alpha-1,3-rhamnosyltransferase